jgi:hypothetical protein
MPRPQFTDGGDGLQVWNVAVADSRQGGGLPAWGLSVG